MLSNGTKPPNKSFSNKNIVMDLKSQTEAEEPLIDPMDNEKLEFFKLDETDRRVLFWLMDNAHTNSLKSWMDYIAEEYKERGIDIDVIKLYQETQGRE
jgi:hypothetical protein